MSINHFTELLADRQTTPTEAWVRRGLACLEADFRELALLTLAEWDGLGVAAPELFAALAALQRPAWGHWNGLLAAIRNARKSLLRSGTAGERDKIQKCAGLNARLDRLDESCGADLGQELKPLGDLARTPIAKEPRLAAVLALPIGLRNIVTHFAPAEPDWWQRAADALVPLIRFHASRSVAEPAQHPAPWFQVENGVVWAFNGLRDDAVVYVSGKGQPRYVEKSLRPVLLAVQRMLGKTDMQHENLRRLLHRLAPEQLKGVLLGDYLVGRPVGQGGYATVHVGTQLSTGRKVAVKILQDGLDEDARLRFQHEAVYLSQLNHPHVVRVLGSGEGTCAPPHAVSLDDEPWYREFSRSAPVKSYIVLEWLEGPTLEEIYQKGPAQKPSTTELAGWLGQAAGALAAVHAAGLLHRDVKPGNLMLTHDGVLKLMDFGIARSSGEVRTLKTTPGRVLGTPAYMSPEQLAARDPDAEVGPASDVYSLCATFYELFAGVRLFAHDTETMDTVRTRKLAGERPEPPRRHAGNLPWELDTILMGGLEPEPGHRYRTMGALESDVRHFLEHRPIEYKKPSSWRRLQLWYKRNPALAWTGTAAAAFLVAFAVTAATFAVFQAGANETITNTNNKLTTSNTALNKTKGSLESTVKLANESAAVVIEQAKSSLEESRNAVQSARSTVDQRARRIAMLKEFTPSKAAEVKILTDINSRMLKDLSDVLAAKEIIDHERKLFTAQLALRDSEMELQELQAWQPWLETAVALARVKVSEIRLRQAELTKKILETPESQERIVSLKDDELAARQAVATAEKALAKDRKLRQEQKLERQSQLVKVVQSAEDRSWKWLQKVKTILDAGDVRSKITSIDVDALRGWGQELKGMLVSEQAKVMELKLIVDSDAGAAPAVVDLAKETKQMPKIPSAIENMPGDPKLDLKKMPSAPTPPPPTDVKQMPKALDSSKENMPKFDRPEKKEKSDPRQRQIDLLKSLTELKQKEFDNLKSSRKLTKDRFNDGGNVPWQELLVFDQKFSAAEVALLKYEMELHELTAVGDQLKHSKKAEYQARIISALRASMSSAKRMRETMEVIGEGGDGGFLSFPKVTRADLDAVKLWIAELETSLVTELGRERELGSVAPANAREELPSPLGEAIPPPPKPK